MLVNCLPVCSDIFYLTTYLKVGVLLHSESMTAFNLCLYVTEAWSGSCLLKSIVDFWASQVALVVKNLAASAGDLRYAGWEGPLEEEMATHSSIVARKIPRTEEPGGLQSTELHRVGHD